MRQDNNEIRILGNFIEVPFFELLNEDNKQNKVIFKQTVLDIV